MVCPVYSEICDELSLSGIFTTASATFLYIATPLPSRHIRDVTIGDVELLSECAKHCSLAPDTVVKLMVSYLTWILIRDTAAINLKSADITLDTDGRERNNALVTLVK